MNIDPMNIDAAIDQVAQGKDLSADQMQSLIEQMLSGQANDESIGKLLLGLRAKGEAVSELVGAARAMRAHMTPVRTRHTNLLDTCGTGGDGAKTFNISTAAAIVAAAAGVPVAKHGNRKITSATGSADVLQELGIRIEAERETVEKCIDQLGIGFCFAPLLHPAMRHVAQVRRSLGVPTLFNYLGPLCNPAAAPFQVLGVGKPELQEKIAKTLSQLPIQRAIVVRGLDGMDEVSLSSDTEVMEVTPGSILLHQWTPESFGLKPISPESLYADGPASSAQCIRDVLTGKPGGPRDIVVANAAAGLWAAGLVSSLVEGVQAAQAAIDQGRAQALLEQLAAMSHEGSSGSQG